MTIDMRDVWFWGFVAVFTYFAVFESYALYTGNMTLSAFVRGAGVAYPWMPAAVVIFMFGLFVHFWWQWHK